MIINVPQKSAGVHYTQPVKHQWPTQISVSWKTRHPLPLEPYIFQHLVKAKQM